MLAITDSVFASSPRAIRMAFVGWQAPAPDCPLDLGQFGSYIPPKLTVKTSGLFVVLAILAKD
jgi:hypothetical protein